MEAFNLSFLKNDSQLIPQLAIFLFPTYIINIDFDKKDMLAAKGYIKARKIKESLDFYKSVNVADVIKINVLAGPQWAQYQEKFKERQEIPCIPEFINKVLTGENIPIYD